MQAINHTLTATIIALTVRNPEVVAPVALASHFALDMVPHYENVPPWRGGSKRLYNDIIYIDALTTLAAFVLSLVVWPTHAWIIALAVFLAISPDTFWAFQRRIRPETWLGRYLKWHKAIQWSESNRGIVMEALWLVAAVAILVNLS